MANSNWVEADKQCQQSSLSYREAFASFCSWFALSYPRVYGDYWYIKSIYGDYRLGGYVAAELVFWFPGDPEPLGTIVVGSFEELEQALVSHDCPIPNSLATILHEYRQGRDGKAAVEFYTQSGDVF